MKSTGKKAWLITLEGSESDYYGRCKVVTILRPQLGTKNIAFLLPILFSSEYNYTLCEKMGFGSSSDRDPFFKEIYRDINPEICYGQLPKIYLRARQVKNLRCEENQTDCFESTLYWTELTKFIPNPKYGLEGPLLGEFDDALVKVIGERDVHYTYSIRPSIEARRHAGRSKIDNQ
jgi:hypothetical protein